MRNAGRPAALCPFILFSTARGVPGSGEHVEDAFLETAKQIYQNIQDGRWVDAAGIAFASRSWPGLGVRRSSILPCSLDLNVAESGVQQKQASNTGQGAAGTRATRYSF